MRTTFVLALLAGCAGESPSTGPTKTQQSPSAELPTNPPGTRTLSRLNAVEYDTILRDLLGTEKQPGREFPPDEIGYGFDNVGEVLTTTSTHVELWETATDTVLDEMFGRSAESTVEYGVQAEDAGVTYLGEGQLFDDTFFALTDGSLSTPFNLDYDGTFEVEVGAFGRPDGSIDPQLILRVDGVDVQSFTVANLQGNVDTFTVQVPLDSGLHTFEAAIGNGAEGELAVVVDYLRVTGPIDPQTGRTEAYARFVPCALDGQPTRGCASTAIEDFGLMAWRRPLSTEEVNWALGLFDAALNADLDNGDALQLAFKGLLMSPEFWFRPERDPADGESAVKLDGYEVATRLAEFAWSSIPDETLLNAAATGQLDTKEGVIEQFGRMLADPRADALVENLAGQWFAVRKLDGVSLDAVLYPEFDDAMRQSMQGELKLVLRQWLRDGGTLDDALVGRKTFVDQRLADAYGLPYTGSGDDFVQVSTEGTDRYGLLGTGGWLAANSRSNGPSAVKRGKWVLENLLCSPPPPPPPNVESSLVIVPDDGSVREQEEAFRSDDFCQTCHSQMDPLGFALNEFDSLGRTRTIDELGFPIDSETLWNGTPLAGPADLATLVLADPRLDNCVVQKTLTYALGRGPTTEDSATVDQITAAFEADGKTFDALANAIVTSDAFRFRGPAPEVK